MTQPVNPAAVAAPVKAAETVAPVAPAKAQWIKSLDLNYNAASSVFHAPDSIESTFLYGVSKVVCAVAAAFTAIIETFQNVGYAVANAAIWAANGVHSFFETAEEPATTVAASEEAPVLVKIEETVPAPVDAPVAKIEETVAATVEAVAAPVVDKKEEPVAAPVEAVAAPVVEKKEEPVAAPVEVVAAPVVEKKEEPIVVVVPQVKTWRAAASDARAQAEAFVKSQRKVVVIGAPTTGLATGLAASYFAGLSAVLSTATGLGSAVAFGYAANYIANRPAKEVAADAAKV